MLYRAARKTLRDGFRKQAEFERAYAFLRRTFPNFGISWQYKKSPDGDFEAYIPGLVIQNTEKNRGNAIFGMGRTGPESVMNLFGKMTSLESNAYLVYKRKEYPVPSDDGEGDGYWKSYDGDTATEEFIIDSATLTVKPWNKGYSCFHWQVQEPKPPVPAP
ncbi:MAG: hypothetical protein L6Q57_02255 [Alphaproteobacteria bacterium]|nr:hypothetical protein [Alphaproteobacteria bacterium]